MDIGILTFLPPEWRTNTERRNDLIALEQRLRFILSGWQLGPALGGEPFHPDEHFVDSTSLARLQLHHLLEREICVLLLFVPGAVDHRPIVEIARYLDCVVRPPLPLFLLGHDSAAGAAGALLRASGDLKLLRRSHHAALTVVEEADRGFEEFGDLIERARDDARRAGARLAFRDDFRRHRHLRIAPGGESPLQWRLADADALRTLGITTRTVDATSFAARVRQLLRPDGSPLDGRLVRAAAHGAGAPGDLLQLAATYAARDLADEHLAQSVALGPHLPAGVDAPALARTMSQLDDPAGSPWPPIPAAAGDDDLGALTQSILQRCRPAPAERAPSVFNDPAQIQPARAALTLSITALGEREFTVAAAGADLAAQFPDDTLTAARASVGSHGPEIAAWPCGRVTAGPHPGTWRVPCNLTRQALLSTLPTDRVSLLGGEVVDTVFAFARALGFSPIQP